MDQLSTINDITISILGIAPVILAVVLVVLVLRHRESLTLDRFTISNRVYVVVIGIVTVVLAFLCAFLRFSVHPPGGTDFYYGRALNIARFGVFGAGNVPSALFPPGYSFLMVPAALALGDSHWAFFFTNVVILLATSVAVRFMLLQLGITAGQANLFSLVILLYPNRLLSTLLPFSDVPFSSIYLCSFLLMIIGVLRPERRSFPVVAGLMAGIAALVRATGLPLLLPLMLGFWLPFSGFLRKEREPHNSRFRLRNVALFLAAALLVILPWSIRNVVLFGKVIPVSNNFGVNLAIGSNPAAGVTHNDYIDSLARDASQWRSFGGDSNWNEAQVDSFLLRRGLEYIESRPISFIVRGFGKVFHTFASDASTFGQHQTYSNLGRLIYRVAEWMHLGPSGTAIAYAVYASIYRFLFVANNTFYYALFALVLLVLFRHRRRWSGPEVAYMLVIIITSGLTFVLFGNSRFKEPVPTLTLMLLILELANSGRAKESVPAPSGSEMGIGA